MADLKAYDIIIKPVRSEKGFEGIADKRYTFIVAKNANKSEIKKAVESIFGVSVAKVNTLNCKGKYKRQGKNEGYTSDYKKAYVQLTESSKEIEFFKGLA